MTRILRIFSHNNQLIGFFNTFPLLTASCHLPIYKFTGTLQLKYFSLLLLQLRNMTRILRIGHYHSKLLLYGKIRLLFLISGISTPTVYFTNMDNSTIYMEEITDSQTVREYIQHVQATEDSDSVNSILKPLGETIGAVLGKLHMNNIVHGDLTTSNMLLRGLPADLDLFLIDFGLSHFENFAEEKGVDLYVLERAILSTHPNTEDLFQTILDNYMKYNKKGAPEVIAKLDEVRLRGRKRTMVG